VQRGKDGVEGISRQDIEAFIEYEQDRGMKPLTVHGRLRTVKAFMGQLIEKEVVAPEVVSRRMTIKVPDALPRAMDGDDVRRLLGFLDRVRDRAMVLVLLRTGMRIGELLTTRLRDIHLKERRIEIYEAQKTAMGRVVYMSDDAVGALRAWVGEREEADAYLFHGRGGKPLCYEAARKSFEICLEKAGLSQKGYTLHCLRHTFATDLLNAGMRLEYVQALLGHNSIEMTRRYARLTDKSREEEYFKAMAMIERGERDEHDRLDG
jgi:site-specific recombinase XerD